MKSTVKQLENCRYFSSKIESEKFLNKEYGHIENDKLKQKIKKFHSLTNKGYILKNEIPEI